MSSERRAGFIWVLLAAAGYAFLPVFTRMIYTMSDLQPTDIAIWRFVFATPIIWLVVSLHEQVQPNIRPKSSLPIVRLLAMGIFLAFSALLAFIGLRYIAASLFIVLFYTYPAMVAIISTFLGTRLSLVGWIALALTLIGIFLTVPDFSSLDSNSTVGIIIALSNGLLVAVYFVIISRVMKGIASIGRGTAWIITGTLLSLLLTIPFYGLQVPPNLTTWLVLMALAAISTVMPIFTMNIGIQLIGAPQATIISSAEPVISMLLAVTIIGETILGLQWLGAAFIVGGVILLEAYPAGRKTAPNPTV